MSRSRLRLAALLGLAGLLLLAAGLLAGPIPVARTGADPAPPAVADTGVLTMWPLPSTPARGPWQIKWDSQRNQIWFAEGNHTMQTLDRVASIDPATGLLREWGGITMNGSVHGTNLDHSGNIWFTESSVNKIGRL